MFETGTFSVYQVVMFGIYFCIKWWHPGRKWALFIGGQRARWMADGGREGGGLRMGLRINKVFESTSPSPNKTYQNFLIPSYKFPPTSILRKNIFIFPPNLRGAATA